MIAPSNGPGLGPTNQPTDPAPTAQAYTSVVFGAAGIIYFALDSWVTRVGSVVGIGPATPFMTATANGGGTPINASGASQRASVLLWEAAVRHCLPSCFHEDCV
eukprot:SAG22_NODE_9838_length_567_cov_0.884615_1_plen_104_part_00